MRYLPTVSAALIGAAVLLSGCGVPSSPSTPTPDPTVLAPPSITEPAVTPTSTLTAPAGTPAPTGAVDRAVASRPGSFDSVRVTGTLYPVRRSGATATVNLLVESKNPDEPFTVSKALSDRNPETSSTSNYSPDGLRIIDAAAKKAYLPATIPDGSCICTPKDDLVGTPQTVLWVSVTFAAPPTATTAVDVFVPTFGTFSGVPVL